MYNVVEYLNGFDEKFIELFYSIRINKNHLYLQGYVNKDTLVAVENMGVPKIAATCIEIKYTSTTGIEVCITLTLPLE
jgi:hypothetical protein